MHRDTRVLIIEPGHGGHHATYLRWLVSDESVRPADVRFATFAESLGDDPRLRELADTIGGAGRVTAIPNEIPERLRGSSSTLRELIERDVRYHRAIGRMFRAAREVAPVDRVLLPYVDYAAYAIALRGAPFDGVPWDGLAVRPSFHYRRMGVLVEPVRWRWVKERLYWRLAREPHLGTLFTIDPLFEEYAKRAAPGVADRIVHVPEAAEVGAPCAGSGARERLGVPRDAFVLLVYGELRGRKGITRILDASSWPEFPWSVHILLAGPQQRDVRRLLDEPRARELRALGRLTELDEVIRGHREGDVFAAADAVWLGYEGHSNMSAVLLQAGRAGLPVIACREGMIGRCTSDHELGLVVDVSDAGEIARACHRLAFDASLAARLGGNGRAFTRDRTPREFARRIWSAALPGDAPTCGPAAGNAADDRARDGRLVASGSAS